jgi:sigma-E factor negative regulatory protein RseA
MSEQIREQVSAFLDGELPGSETELLLKRLTRDPELRDSFGRYALIGEALRGSNHALLLRGFDVRVNRAIDGGALPAVMPQAPARSARWWRPFAGTAVVAGVAAVAIVTWQQRSAVAPVVTAGGTAAVAEAWGPALAANHEAISYTVPASAAAKPAGRLTNYMFAHSKYSYGLGQRGVLADLLIEDDEPAGALHEAAQPMPVRLAP